MRRIFESLVLPCAIALICVTPARAQFTLLYSFTGGDSDGGAPSGSLMQSESTLYGMTTFGNNGNGTIFKIGIDGTGFNLLHSFTGNPSAGLNPIGSLIQSGSALYGTATGGNTIVPGSIFQIGTDGTGFSLLHSFTGNSNDGNNPFGSLIQSGSNLYGMTYGGGSNGSGTIFRIGTDGTGFGILHSFTANASEGSFPYGSLIQVGSTLYGMTDGGGSNGSGTIFRIGIDGTGFSLLHSFAGGTVDGSYPVGSLIQSGASLYGMTNFGGAAGAGTIFQIGIDGSGFNVLHSFTGNVDDGSNPLGSLIQSGATLYGMTPGGGSDGYGTIFQIGIDGSGFNVLHSFTESVDDGEAPYGSLIVSDSTVYGMTSAGGSYGFGTIFSLAVPEPATFALANVACVFCLWLRPRTTKAPE